MVKQKKCIDAKHVGQVYHIQKETYFHLFEALGSVLHPSVSKQERLGVKQVTGGTHESAWMRDVTLDWHACVGWEGVTHTLTAPLSADSENMFAWDKSTKTHPSPGSKCALRHSWHGVNNLTLTAVGEARGRMETETEREMDWPVIDIQFELLQIFSFSWKIRTWSDVYAPFRRFDCMQTVYVPIDCREDTKQRCICGWPSL